MKKHTILYAIIFYCIAASAQKPEEIFSFATLQKPVPWYKEQVKAWQNELKKDSSNAFAWYSYYRATRNLLRTDTTDKRSHDEKWKILGNIVEDMGKAVPNSYEYNLCKWMNGGSDYQYLPYLKKAVSLGKDRTEHIPDMINWGDLDRDIAKRNEYAKKWYESKMASPGLLNYNYNVIIGLKPNAIIITIGDNDTYPIWQLQSQGIRTDITVLNINLLSIDTFRDKIFKELSIPTWDTVVHGKSIYSANPYRSEMVRHIATSGTKHPTYIALTTDPEYFKPFEDKLYLVGLAYEYSNEAVDNLGVMKRNFEQLFALDYIDKSFFQDISADRVKDINCNYIVPMLKLYDHYKASGDLQKLDWIKGKIVYLAKGKDDEKEILKYLSKN